MSERRLAGWAGVAFVVALGVQFALAPAPPDFDAPAAEIRAYLVDNRSGILGQGFMQLIAITFGVVFFVGLANRVRSATDGELWGRVVIVAAGILAATVLVAQAGFNAPVWIDGNAQTMSDDLTTTLWSFSYAVFAAGAPAIALLTGSTALAGFRGRVVPVWVSWIAAAASVIALAAFSMQFGSDFGFFGLGAFVALMVFALATSIAMIRDRSATSA
jgi:hypothetical protein